MNNAPASAELSPRAIGLGLLLAAILGAANVYLGLKVGMTVSASIPAAVVGMLVLRRLMRNGTVLEANQVQTAASAGESLAAGILFTVPALLLIGVWTEFAFWPTTLIAISGIFWTREVQETLHAGFKEWLVKTGNIRQLSDLAAVNVQ